MTESEMDEFVNEARQAVYEREYARAFNEEFARAHRDGLAEGYPPDNDLIGVCKKQAHAEAKLTADSSADAYAKEITRALMSQEDAETPTAA